MLAVADGFHCLSDSKSPPVSRTLRSVLADLNNAILWAVSTLLFQSHTVTLIILW